MDEAKPNNHRPDRLTAVLRWVLALMAAALVLGAGWVAFVYMRTPEALRYPTQAHYHFRLQVISDGQVVDFAQDKFQTSFNKDICTAALTREPAHFHDKLDQFVHIHWRHLTGGIVLKNYGWNYIGGSGGTLGYRFDQLPRLQRVPVHGRDLPPRRANVKHYVYVSSPAAPTDYRQQSWRDFLHLDLEDFFSAKPGVRPTSWLDRIVPAASAHGHDEQLSKLNKVLGNVVIFAQKDPPTDAQIKARFERLVPLPESACGG